MNYITSIGLEVHIQLQTKSKIFCSCPTTFGEKPNTNICPVCCGYPGVLPVLNKKVLELGVRVGLGLECRINRKIYFERKNYFYPDLPKNYQISQYLMPLAEEGYITIPGGKKIRIKRAHLEEDAGKLIHRDDCSLVDFNRAGIPLLEIVTYPDIESAKEAYEYLKTLKQIVQYLDASSCDMEKGYLRCDANISVRPQGQKELGVKTELKNMNSFKGVRDALTYEIKRHIETLENGGKITQQTLLWDEKQGKTVVMRTKEEAHDYRYFPEPDLVSFVVSEELIQNEKIPELPLARKERLIADSGLSEKDAEVICSLRWIADFFEDCLKFYNEPKKIANWILGPLLEEANTAKNYVFDLKVKPDNFAKLIRYFSEGKINNIAAKKAFSKIAFTNEEVDKIIKQENLAQVSNEEDLVSFVRQAIENNPKAVKDYLAGKEQAVMFLVGQVMRLTKGRSNPKVVKEIITKEIDKGQSS